MRRTTLILILLVLSTTVAQAATFEPAPYLAQQGVDVLTRQTALELTQRQLFGDPYATVVVGNVDIYEGFPYLESRWFQIVSDPKWNRLLFGESGQGLSATDGTDTSFGALSAPHGMSTDGYSRVFVADTGNDRILAFAVDSEFDQLSLRPLFSLEGLNAPYDVAFSDGGTPMQEDDDLLYVANSGRNEVVSYRILQDRTEFLSRIGSLGSGSGFFAGPMAITVGRDAGRSTRDVYVADAHNRRIVHLSDQGNSLSWEGSLPQNLGMISSLDTDQWGDVYAAAPQEGMVVKYTPTMLPVAELKAGMHRPRSVHVPYVRVTDHRTGTVYGAGQGSALVVEQWGADSGLRLMTLGVEIDETALVPAAQPRFSFTMSDHARVQAEIVDPKTDRLVASLSPVELDAGRHELEFSQDSFVAPWSSGDYQLRLTAQSSYDESITAQSQLDFAMSGAGGPSLPLKPTLLGNAPNPFNPTTAIRFVVPSGPAVSYHITVYDASGRTVRQLASGQASTGIHEVIFDGKDDEGRPIGSGVYLYRLELGRETLVSKMVLVK